MGRYSDILRGPELALAYTAYQAYLAKDRTAKKAAYAALNVNRLVASRIAGALIPFGAEALAVPALVPTDTPPPDVTATTAEQKEADAPMVARIRTILGTRMGQTTITAPMRLIEIPKFKFAKLALKRRTGTGTTEQISRFTGISYKRRQTNTLSSPFGGLTDAETFEAAVGAIKGNGELKIHTDAGGSYSITPQMTLIA